MATNNFKAFALDPNANVTPQANWEALPALLSGFTAGKASSAQVNKALRQATTIAALVGQFIANSGVDALDNADVNGLVTKFTNALTTNLGLGTASKRNVGNGANQIPDMSFFTKTFSGGNVTGVFTFPNGMIVQIGSIGAIPAGTSLEVVYPIPFPTAMCYATGVASSSSDSTVPISIAIDAQNVSDAKKSVYLRNSSTRSNAGSRFLAIGY
ncbi:gp53-like domain-containing protein [Enterobacter ludwigii]|uniref:gp53-like domain-containing protein n=1 Tax=Enterobacter ludwigii TaxID=299767 RepID=UPI001E5841A4|nr:hypothetical protein [Enterobacter ludwigii]MCE1611326.1 hypothetical protein [Enterobacter ludwigii]MCE1624628.1 hypothetical protein [Enterobacter ludwigii]